MLKDTFLKNGIRVIAYEKTDWPVENIGIWFKCGFRDEKIGEASWTHLLEHLIANGSAKFPTEIEQSKITTDTGSYFNAFTWLEHMAVQTEFLPEYLDNLFDFMADKILNPILNQKSIDREKKIINEEYMKNLSDPNLALYRYSISSIFKNTKLANIPIGKKYALGEVSEKDMVAFHQQLLTSVPMIILAVGPINHNTILEKASEYFSKLKTEYIKREIIDNFSPQTIDEDIISKGAKLVRINFLTVPRNDDRSYVFDLANALLSYGKDSELYKTLRLEKGLVYQISAENYPFSDAGFFSIYFPSTNTAEAKNIIFERLESIPETITESRLKIIKQRLINFRKRNLLRSAENIQINIGRNLMIDDIPLTEEKYEEKINSIDLQTFKTVFREYLNLQKAIILETK